MWEPPSHSLTQQPLKAFQVKRGRPAYCTAIWDISVSYFWLPGRTTLAFGKCCIIFLIFFLLLCSDNQTLFELAALWLISPSSRIEAQCVKRQSVIWHIFLYWFQCKTCLYFADSDADVFNQQTGRWCCASWSSCYTLWKLCKPRLFLGKTILLNGLNISGIIRVVCSLTWMTIKKKFVIFTIQYNKIPV